MGRSQQLDGLMDVTGDPNGSFALARASYGGIQDITDYSDTELRTVSAELDYSVTTAWGLSFGYWYERYTFADAFSAGTETYPLSRRVLSQGQRPWLQGQRRLCQVDLFVLTSHGGWDGRPSHPTSAPHAPLQRYRSCTAAVAATRPEPCQ